MSRVHPVRKSGFKQLSLHEASSESLVTASSFASMYGPPPNSFTSLIRQLNLDVRRGSATFSSGSEYQLLRLLKGPTFLTNLYYSTKRYVPERWTMGSIREPIDMARSYDMETLSAIIALCYLYKKAKRLTDSEEWRFVGDPIEGYADVGMHVGRQVEGIGAFAGLVSGTFLQLGLAALCAEDKAGFQQYRRTLKGKACFEEKYEMQRWGCTSYEIGACLLITMGFTIDQAEAFRQGFDRSAQGACGEPYRQMHRVFTALARGEALRDDGPLSKAVEEAGPLLEDPNRLRWLSRSKEDANEALKNFSLGGRHSTNGSPHAAAPAPELSDLQSAVDEFAAPVLPQRCRYEELPESLQKEIAPEDFVQIQHMSLQEILDLFQ